MHLVSASPPWIKVCWPSCSSVNPLASARTDRWGFRCRLLTWPGCCRQVLILLLLLLQCGCTQDLQPCAATPQPSGHRVARPCDLVRKGSPAEAMGGCVLRPPLLPTTEHHCRLSRCGAAHATCVRRAPARARRRSLGGCQLPIPELPATATAAAAVEPLLKTDCPLTATCRDPPRPLLPSPQHTGDDAACPPSCIATAGPGECCCTQLRTPPPNLGGIAVALPHNNRRTPQSAPRLLDRRRHERGAARCSTT
jgi:hypothetical protein